MHAAEKRKPGGWNEEAFRKHQTCLPVQSCRLVRFYPDTRSHRRRIRLIVPVSGVFFSSILLGRELLVLEAQFERMKADPDRIFPVLVLCLLAVQIAVSLIFPMKPRNDLKYVCHAAQNIILGGNKAIHRGMPEYHRFYFYTYPNNQMILLIVTGLYRIEYFFTKHFSNFLPVLINIFSLNFSVVLVYLRDQGALSVPLPFLRFLFLHRYSGHALDDGSYIPVRMSQDR